MVLLANGADWAWALAELDTALADDLEASDRAALINAVVALRAPRGEAVAALVDEVTRLVGSSTESQLLASLEGARASAAFGSGRIADALGTWGRLAEVSAEYLPVTLARAARAALWLGDATAAATDLVALGAWRDLGLLWDEALAGIDMATLLDPADPDVRAAADRSREILVGLGATPFIARLDAALAAGPHADTTTQAPSGDRARV